LYFIAKTRLLVKEFIGKRHIASSLPGHIGCSPQAISSSLQVEQSQESIFLGFLQARQESPKKKNEKESFRFIPIRRTLSPKKS
jgi:hypothetical protein